MNMSSKSAHNNTEFHTQKFFQLTIFSGCFSSEDRKKAEMSSSLPSLFLQLLLKAREGDDTLQGG